MRHYIIAILIAATLAVTGANSPPLKAEKTVENAAASVDVLDLAAPLPPSKSKSKTTTGWSVEFGSNHLNMSMTQVAVMDLTIKGIDPAWGDDFELHVVSDHPELLRIERVIYAEDVDVNATSWRGNFTMEALFLGAVRVYVELRRPDYHAERSQEFMEVIMTRALGLMDDIYKISVGSLVLILYVNFGAVLDLYALKRIILRPVGPAIGFVGQFFFMPLLSFLIGYFVFPDMIELRLGLLFTGSTPGGGFSNIFTVVLSGNINLSITMTAFSNLAAFGMMPLWIFTLGSLILKDGNFAIPYETIATMSFSLLLPLALGIALQKYAPALTRKISKHLQPISFVLILFVMAFAFTINSYMFSLLSWKMLLACAALPWIGYVLGYLLALICRQNAVDALTIAIETGIQNTGIAIFMLSFTLPQPQADITSAIPVTNFLLTPVPLMVIYLVRKLCCQSPAEVLEDEAIKDGKEFEIETMLEKGQVQMTTIVPST